MKLYDLLTVVDEIQPIHIWMEGFNEQTDGTFAEGLKEYYYQSKKVLPKKYTKYEVTYVGTDVDENYLFIELKRKVG